MKRQGAAACIALAALAACRPSAEGRCAQDSDCRTGAFCSPEGICLALAPSITVSVVTPADANGWFSRSGGDLQILAQITRDGTDPVSAVLALAACSAPSCTFAGVASAQGFTFTVPRDVQAIGSAAPLPFQVTVTDRAGNKGIANGTLQIDAAPPSITSYAPVVAGTAGEDLQAWFAGGPGAQAIEVAVRVSDPGAGVSSVALHVDANDVQPGTPLDPAPSPAPDGSFHFQLPANAAFAEGPLHFARTATDALGLASTIPAASLLVDAVPPSVTAPQVNYAGASPAGVCDSSATCGRQSGTRLLRDDTADLAFDVTDCGVGTASAAVQVAGGKTVAAVEIGSDPSSCPNGNRTHHFKATVNFGDAAPALPAADSGGTVSLPVHGTALDLVANGATTAGSAADGVAAISLWRWKKQIAGKATGSPVLLGGANGRVAIGSASAVTALSAAGAQSWTQTVSAGTGADLALGPGGAVYAVAPAGSCGSSCTGTLSIVTAAAVTTCQHSCVTFGAPPAITTSTVAGSPVEVAIVVATARNTGVFCGGNNQNLLVYQTNCTVSQNTYLINNTNDLTAVSAVPGKVVLGSAATFVSIDQNGLGFNFGSAATYNVSTVSLLDAPGLIPGSSINAIFGTSTGYLHRTTATSTCTGANCWSDAYAPTPFSSGGLPTAPVFDGTHVYTADGAGNVSSWNQSTGAVEWTQALGSVISGAAILQSASPSVLVVRQDGTVQVVGASSVVSLLTVGPYSAAPPVPAIEASGSYGLAYVPDGGGLVWAVDLPAPPMQASATAWPRPGRDSCNSRSAGAPCP